MRALRGHGEGGVSALCRHGATLASGGDEGTVRLWHAGSGEAGLVIRAQHCRVTALRLCPGGMRVAAGGFDRCVRLFATADGTSLGTLSGHNGWVSALAWSYDGSLLLSGSYDGDVRVWAPAPLGAAGGGAVLRGVLRGGGDAPNALLADPGTAAAVARRGSAPEERMVSALLLDPPPPEPRFRAADDCAAAAAGDGAAAGIAPSRRRHRRGGSGSAFGSAGGDGGSPPCSRVYVGTMDGTISLWDLEACEELATSAPCGAGVYALTHCADAAGAGAEPCPFADGGASGADTDMDTTDDDVPLCGSAAPSAAASGLQAQRRPPVRFLAASAHRDGSLRGWRVARAVHRRGALRLEAAWALHGAHGDWATQLCCPVIRSPHMLFSGGEDGALHAWRVAAPRAWTRDAHTAFPDGFRAAIRAFLLVLNRLSVGDADDDGEDIAALATPSAAAMDIDAQPAAVPRRSGRASRDAVAASPASPVACTPARRRPMRASRGGVAGGSASVTPTQASPPPSAALLPQRPPRMGPLRVHGATRDALVDLIAAALAQLVYPDGSWRGPPAVRWRHALTLR